MVVNPLNYAQDKWVQVDLDYADQIAARAEYTLVLLGPPRVAHLSGATKALLTANEPYHTGAINKLMNLLGSLTSELKAIGLAQGVGFSVYRQRIPVTELGSEMMAFVSGQTTQAQVSIQRLVVDNPNFIKEAKDTAPSDLNDSPKSMFDAGLHGKASKWPFGLGLVFYAELSDKPIGKLYIEACKIVSLGTQISSGAPVIYEGIQIVGHRINAIE